MVLSVAYVAGMILFALATLPVGLGASRRALTLLSGSGLTDPEETGAIRRELTAAAVTYVVGLLRPLGLLFAPRDRLHLQVTRRTLEQRLPL